MWIGNLFMLLPTLLFFVNFHQFRIFFEKFPNTITTLAQTTKGKRDDGIETERWIAQKSHIKTRCIFVNIETVPWRYSIWYYWRWYRFKCVTLYLSFLFPVGSMVSISICQFYCHRNSTARKTTMKMENARHVR